MSSLNNHFLLHNNVITEYNTSYSEQNYNNINGHIFSLRRSINLIRRFEYSSSEYLIYKKMSIK